MRVYHNYVVVFIRFAVNRFPVCALLLILFLLGTKSTPTASASSAAWMQFQAVPRQKASTYRAFCEEHDARVICTTTSWRRPRSRRRTACNIYIGICSYKDTARRTEMLSGARASAKLLCHAKRCSSRDEGQRAAIYSRYIAHGTMNTARMYEYIVWTEIMVYLNMSCRALLENITCDDKYVMNARSSSALSE